MMRLVPFACLVAACGNVITAQRDASSDPTDPSSNPANARDAAIADALPDGKVCQQAIDQQLTACTSPPIAQCAVTFIMFTGQSAAQAFKPSSTGSVSHIRLRMNNPAAATNPIQVSIVDFSGDPVALANPSFDLEQHVLARTETPMTVLTTWQDVNFVVPAAVVANQPYGIVVRMVGTSDPGSTVHAGWDLYNDFQGGMVDSYPSGRFFDCGTGCPSWTAEPTFRDAAFEVYVSPSVCP